MRKLFVFVSSTSALADERRHLRDELQATYELYLYEQDRPRRSSPEEHSRAQIEKADVFLGILGGDYGSLFSDADRPRSIVEWEHDVARDIDDLEAMVFVKELPTAERDPRQQAFIDGLTAFRGGLWRQTYLTPTQFARLAHIALERWLGERFTADRDASADRQRRWAGPLGVVAAGVVLVLLGVVLAQGQALSTNAMVGLCMTVTLFVASCFVFHQRL